MKANPCTIEANTVLSNTRLPMSDTDNRELTDEELSNVIGGQSREAFDLWRVKLINETLGSRSYEERRYLRGRY